MAKEEIFNGEAVMSFENDQDRRNFLKWAGIVGVGSSLAVAGFSRGSANAQAEDSDLEILNYALTLEYLEADFYNQGVDGGALSGRELALVTPIRDHEDAHVAALTSTINDLGGTPVKSPKFKYPKGTFTDKAKFLETASVFEELGVTAYHGQVTLIKDPALLGAAAAIAGVESRHAAVLADLTGGNPFPAPVEETATMEQVLEAATPFIKS
jgi:rubrerythrin